MKPYYQDEAVTILPKIVRRGKLSLWILTREEYKVAPPCGEVVLVSGVRPSRYVLLARQRATNNLRIMWRAGFGWAQSIMPGKARR